MVRQCRKLTAAGVLLSAAFSLSASAEQKTEAAKAGKAAPPPQATAAGLDKQEKSKPDKPPVQAEKAEAKADKAEAKAEKAVAKAEAKADRAEAKADRAEAKADKAEAKADKAEAKADKAEDEKAEAKAEGHDGHGHPGAQHPGRGKFKSAVSELREKYKSGSLKKDELDKELRALKENRKERRAEHQRAIKERWGSSLAVPAAREELTHHERRMAKLNRMLLLAEAERKGTAKAKLVERIEKLIAHENERHERKMSQLEATPRAQGSLNAPASTSATMKASAEVPAGQAPKAGGEK